MAAASYWCIYRRELQPDDLINPDDPKKIAIATQGYGVANLRPHSSRPAYRLAGQKSLALSSYIMFVALTSPSV